MVAIFFVEPNGEALHYRQYLCKTCQTLTRVQMGRFELDHKLTWPVGSHESIPCEKCGNPTELSSLRESRIYRRPDTGEEIFNISDHPGACYKYEDEIFDFKTRQMRTGPDGRVLAVILPNRTTWILDQRCSNCTLPGDNVHRCWVRRGSPEGGDLHVSKEGNTCQAGAGSIISGDFHGWLHNNQILPC